MLTLQALAHPLRLVAESPVPKAIAAFVIVPGGAVVAVILAGFAEGKAKVNAVLQRRVLRRLLRHHGGDIRRIETEGLQVCEAPPGVSEIEPRAVCRTVGCHRLPSVANRLERMAQGQL